MVVGNKSRFAIACEIEYLIDNHVLGRFQFWVEEKPIGDWDDLAYLLGCANGLYEFVKLPKNRFELELENKSKEEVFFLLFDSFMPAATEEDVEPPFEGTERRFHISYLGMSSFIDRFDVLLIETECEQRILWRDAKDQVMHEAILPANEIQAVAIEFCRWFASQVPGYSPPKKQFSTGQVYPELPII